MSNQVISHYTDNYIEEIRLTKDNAHRTEFLTTVRYFNKLFAPSSHVLDACAGAGAYSFYLAEKGHIVTAGDITPHHVELIKANPNADKLANVQVCDVLNMPQFESNSFDVVLCMGALYHLHNPTDKQKAVDECVRICKPGGLVVLAYILPWSCVYAELTEDAGNMDELMGWLNHQDEALFIVTTPTEIEGYASNSGLQKLHQIATDGPMCGMKEKLNASTEENFQKYMQWHYSVCEEPSILGASMHGLYIGRKA